ncbi:MAG: hypothetical protein ABI237_15400 [Ginsengibacter sp.]
MKTFIQGKHHLLITIWSLLRNVGYLFIIFILAFVLFSIPDQSKDFVIAFLDHSEPTYYVSVAVLLFLWSYITWYSACVILEISPVNTEFINEKLAENFCLSIGFIPSLIMAFTFFKSEIHEQVLRSIVFGILFLLLGILFLIFFKWRSKISFQWGKWPDKAAIAKHNTDERGYERTPTFMEEINFIRKYPNVIFYFRTIGIAFILLWGLLCIPSILIPVSRILKPASVIILILAFFTYLSTVVYYFHDIKTRPFLFFILGWLIVCSIWNDNTKIPITNNFKDFKDFRLTPTDAFDKWYAIKNHVWLTQHDSSTDMPVIFIATQGGGIRGEMWTSQVLHVLEDSLPGFYNQVFCIGGASGGTVGAIYYNTFVYDSLHNEKADTSINFRNFQNFTKADCISPVTASFAFGETLQHFLPWPVASLERSKIMMNAFSDSYKKNLNSSMANSSLLSMYYPNDDSTQFNCDIPSLFINGMVAETGQRVITSNLRLSESKNFDDDVDFFAKVKGHITIATASLNCMRFPLLLSGGLFSRWIKKDSSYTIGHVVDGGYRENTGLQAMYSLMSELKDKFKGKRIKPILIYLRNGGLEFDVAMADTTNEAIRVLHDLRVPVTGLVSVNGTSLPSLGIMKMIQQQEANDNPLDMYYNQVWLKDPLYHDSLQKFPLGLYMSDGAADSLRMRARQITTINVELMDTLRHYYK